MGDAREPEPVVLPVAQHRAAGLCEDAGALHHWAQQGEPGEKHEGAARPHCAARGVIAHNDFTGDFVSRSMPTAPVVRRCQHGARHKRCVFTASLPLPPVCSAPRGTTRTTRLEILRVSAADGNAHAQLCFSDGKISQIHCCLVAEPPDDAGGGGAVKLRVSIQDFSRNGTFGGHKRAQARFIFKGLFSAFFFSLLRVPRRPADAS